MKAQAQNNTTQSYMFFEKEWGDVYSVNATSYEEAKRRAEEFFGSEVQDTDPFLG